MRREFGFTLVEMLVATALIGLVSLVLFETARFASTSYERRLRASDSVETQVETAARFRRLFENATPAVRETDEGELPAYFDGAADRLRLVAPYDALDINDTGGLAYIELRLDSETGRLLAEYSPFALGGEPIAPRQTVLAEGVAEIAFAYYDLGLEFDDALLSPLGSDLDDEGVADEPGWRKTWKDRPSQPAAIRLSVRDVRGQAWPMLVARVRVRRPAE